MNSTRPYLIRAIYEWCVDQGFTPYLQATPDAASRVPQQFVREGVIVFNVSPTATHQLQIGNEEVTFQARFNGVAFPVLLPVSSVTAIYARENGQGMAFEQDTSGSSGPLADGEQEMDADAGTASHAIENPDSDPEPPDNKPGRPRLTRIK
ncbi:MAG: ClpXP protease specificity-enhancing factor [Proteobacteria bacterium]|nr:ClpXP protease specificity-enhancing factor [Pseudomonadota bacterium]HQR02649.1 ClpXP protease specificity-enhancing factor [Rhodocyclaceae bacterium]